MPKLFYIINSEGPYLHVGDAPSITGQEWPGVQSDTTLMEGKFSTLAEAMETYVRANEGAKLPPQGIHAVERHYGIGIFLNSKYEDNGWVEEWFYLREGKVTRGGIYSQY